jgi:shikimate dehydrogenase
MILFAVAGNPILHSKSPSLFREFSKAHALDAGYTRLGADSPGELFFMAEYLGLEGLNITSPCKELVLPYMGETDENVQETGSVNTAVLRGGRKKGFNTDPEGVSLALKKRGIVAHGKKALVLGAGGAGKAAALALKKMGADVLILNRTIDKAKDYASRIACRAAGLESVDVHLRDAFIVVNTIPEVQTYLKSILPGNKTIFFDAVYSDSALKSICHLAGAPFVPGEEWLINQAYRSFEILTGIRPRGDELDPVSLRTSELSAGEKNISLIGFMGCGKTSVGKRLAERLGFSFVDTDSEIEKKEGMAISDIFRLKGESHFRKKEKEILSRLDSEKNVVFACGGGAVLDEENRKKLREKSIVIWLFTAVEESVKRLKGQERPLLKGKEPVERARDIFRERKEKYFSAADLIISSHANIKEVVFRTHEEINKLP